MVYTKSAVNYPEFFFQVLKIGKNICFLMKLVYFAAVYIYNNKDQLVSVDTVSKCGFSTIYIRGKK